MGDSSNVVFLYPNVTEVNPRNFCVNKDLSVLEQLLPNTKRIPLSSPAQRKSLTTDDYCYYYSGDEEEYSDSELEEHRKVKFVEFINEKKYDECNVAIHQEEDSNNEMNEDDVVKPVNRINEEKYDECNVAMHQEEDSNNEMNEDDVVKPVKRGRFMMLLHTKRSVGTETENILKNAQVQTDVVYLDKTTCGFIAVSREDKQVNFFLCCLYCTEMYSICDWNEFVIHLNAEHDALEQMEAEIDLKSNWPHTAGARVLLRKSEAKQEKVCILEDIQLPNINVLPSDTQIDVSSFIPMSYNLPEQNEISVRDVDSSTVYDNLNFSDSDTDSDTERVFNEDSYDPNLDHCYSQISSPFLKSQPRVHKLRFERTDSAIIMDLLELLRNFPALGYPRNKSEQAYDNGISTVCKILNIRWDLNLLKRGVQRTLEKIKSWYRSILMYSNVRNLPYSMVCSQEYLEYYGLCCNFMPISDEDEPPEIICELCNTKCYDYVKLQMHTFQLHGTGNPPYKCGICSKQFMYLNELQAHFTRHKKKQTMPRAVIVIFPDDKVKKRLLCENCRCVFYDQTELNNHMELHLKDIRPYVCEICGLRFSLASTYSMHKSKAHNLPRYKCDLCGNVFNTGHYFNVHMKRHRSQFDYMCDVCGKMFIRYSTFLQHMEDVHGDQFHCNICNHNFNSKSGLQKHQRKIHEVLEGTIEQLDIPRKSWNKAKMRWYKRRRKFEDVDENEETKKFRLRCPLCPKLYRKHDSLYAHTQKMHGKNVRSDLLLSKKIKKPKKCDAKMFVGSTYPEILYKSEEFDVSETMAATTSITSTNNADTNGGSTECETNVLITEHKVISVNAENTVVPSISTNSVNVDVYKAISTNNENEQPNEGCNDFVTSADIKLRSSLGTTTMAPSMPLLMSPEQKAEKTSSQQLKLADEKVGETGNAFESLYAHDVEDAEFEMVINNAIMDFSSM